MNTFLRPDSGRVFFCLHIGIGLILVQHACPGIVVPLLIQCILNYTLCVKIKNGAQYFHSIIQIARHQVRRANQVAWFAAIKKYINPWMLQITVNNTDRLDIL